jgi:hypothetical protein
MNKNLDDRNTIPATLDMAEHGRMAVNGMFGSLNPARVTQI